ncbi:C-type lectin protein [Penicillium taxi]|uniref:C-type lectin protein n=1 Tax=Penicillium taxi TaxID=168475 RepID=UPI0025450FE7|nr:C-type lectin protein [Penicillium taxi]KAJ5901478.1 C-type lectin protein [Penicillium taxi]
MRTMNLTERLRSASIGFGIEPLLLLPGDHFIDLVHGYIPLLVGFTHEDKEAKGLRKRKPGEKPKPPVYFSAMEVVRDERILLLSGAAGSGKTSFAKHLSYCLARGGFKSRPLIRNELGEVHEESWVANILPSFFTIDDLATCRTLSQTTLPTLVETWLQSSSQGSSEGLLIILDGVENAQCHEGHELLVNIVTLVGQSDSIRLLLLGQTEALENWILPPGVVRHELLPLLVSQRQYAIETLSLLEAAKATDPRRITTETRKIPPGTGLGTSAAVPVVFAMALQASRSGDKAEETLDEWLAVVCPTPELASKLSTEIFHRATATLPLSNDTPLANRPIRSTPFLAFSNTVQQLLVARHLASLNPNVTVDLFYRASLQGDSILQVDSIIRSVLVRLTTSGEQQQRDALIEGLLEGPSAHLSALLIADFVGEEPKFRTQVTKYILDIVQNGLLSINARQKAGCILSTLGDPRDLTGLATVPAGSFTFGSYAHPNSEPVNPASLSSFRIGLYPVVNRDYATFIQETRREWLSPDCIIPKYRNAPATDLTWHDARAYCAWLTKQWRANGRIEPTEEVRLPTELEWERAARGDQTETGEDGRIIYPWGTEWRKNGANSEETGFNRPCAVGIFPPSKFGYDFTGQVWEWVSTCWGENMATPFFKYPYRSEDGREALEGVPKEIRRVLRGGCFSSTRAKASCTYRGSLEPAGFWRGNGFRIAVATVGVDRDHMI